MRGRDWITVPNDAVDALCRDGWRVEKRLPGRRGMPGVRPMGERAILSRVREPALADEKAISACTLPNISDGSGACTAQDLRPS